MKITNLTATAALAAMAFTSAAHAEVPLSTHGTAGSDATGVGIAVEQGVLVIKVNNASGSGNWKDRMLEHNSQGFTIDMEGGVRCKSGFGISHSSLFVGEKEAQSFSPSNLPRERYFADDYFVSPAAFKEGEGTIGFDPVAIVERALADHMSKGGHPVDYLRKDHTFDVWMRPSFLAVCKKKTGMQASTGGYWHRRAIAHGGLRVIVQYNGDDTLSSGRARPGTTTNGGGNGGPPAKGARPSKLQVNGQAGTDLIAGTGPGAIARLDRRAPEGSEAWYEATSEAEIDGEPVPLDDMEEAPEEFANPAEERAERSGGLKETATSFLGGLLRGKKAKDAALDAVLGEDD